MPPPAPLLQTLLCQHGIGPQPPAQPLIPLRSSSLPDAGHGDADTGRGKPRKPAAPPTGFYKQKHVRFVETKMKEGEGKGEGMSTSPSSLTVAPPARPPKALDAQPNHSSVFRARPPPPLPPPSSSSLPPLPSLAHPPPRPPPKAFYAQPNTTYAMRAPYTPEVVLDTLALVPKPLFADSASALGKPGSACGEEDRGDGSGKGKKRASTWVEQRSGWQDAAIRKDGRRKG
ncbi:MAG: hypothetical protein M1832_004962 [Thelocarpon impressellum]|nr:MAG: hypothetical protein M1832_004962 [Thelocarpon impressellum]